MLQILGVVILTERNRFSCIFEDIIVRFGELAVLQIRDGIRIQNTGKYGIQIIPCYKRTAPCSYGIVYAGRIHIASMRYTKCIMPIQRNIESNTKIVYVGQCVVIFIREIIHIPPQFIPRDDFICISVTDCQSMK